MSGKNLYEKIGSALGDQKYLKPEYLLFHNILYEIVKLTSQDYIHEARFNGDHYSTGDL